MHGTHWIFSPRAALPCHSECCARVSGSVEIHATSFPAVRWATQSMKTSGEPAISCSTNVSPFLALMYSAPKIWPRWASINDAKYGETRSDWAATASSLDTATIGLLKTSLQALIVVRPMRTPVNEPGPDAATNTSTSPKVVFEAWRAKSTAGSSQEEYSSALVCVTTCSNARSCRTATLALASHVSIARTIIYEQFYHTLILRSFHFGLFTGQKCR